MRPDECRVPGNAEAAMTRRYVVILSLAFVLLTVLAIRNFTYVRPVGHFSCQPTKGAPPGSEC
jgi:hypothetical protein